MVAVVDIDEPHGRQTAATITGDSGQALFVAADVASPANVPAAVDQVVERWERGGRAGQLRGQDDLQPGRQPRGRGVGRRLGHQPALGGPVLQALSAAHAAGAIGNLSSSMPGR
jgi:hypothetical protein